jgi:hypothetical protein
VLKRERKRWPKKLKIKKTPKINSYIRLQDLSGEKKKKVSFLLVLVLKRERKRWPKKLKIKKTPKINSYIRLQNLSVSFTREFLPNFDLKNMVSTYTKDFL